MKLNVVVDLMIFHLSVQGKQVDWSGHVIPGTKAVSKGEMIVYLRYLTNQFLQFFTIAASIHLECITRDA